jgi:hypothetical protein
MSYASTAALATNAYCEKKFNNVGMASTWFNGGWADSFDHSGHMTHKHFDSDRMTKELGEPEGSGVYGGWGMKDGSILLLTCNGKLAYCDKDDSAKWGD